MKVTKEEYDFFREKCISIKDLLSEMHNKIGNVPLTEKFCNTISNIVSDMQQMYYTEIKDDDDKKTDKEIMDSILKERNYK